MVNFLWFFSWYVIITLVGWGAFPLANRFFHKLPDRGYALSRAFGWLVWGFLFWGLGSLGILQNSAGSMLLAFALILVLSAACVWGAKWGELWDWLREHKDYLISAEAIFLAAFALMAFIRASNPNVDYTEKPMEMAFLNAILKSPTFPPHDPWLSGYAISYYYFGYVLVSMLIRLSGVITGVGFNLAIALLFGLTAVGAYGVLYDLLALRRQPAADQRVAHSQVPLGLPILGPFFILLMSNLEGILTMLHSKGLFWPQNGSASQSNFWTWLGVLDLNTPPKPPFSWIPPDAGWTWWWRGSRVLADYNLSGGFKEVIDEFPFFSYLLSDLHPHVLAMPFAMLMVGLALNVWQSARDEGTDLFGFHLPFSRGGFLLAAVLLGGLAFLNTWDFPIYIALVAGAYTLGRLQERGLSWGLLGDFLGLAALLGIVGAVFYIPFYIGFSSQAGGILPSVIFFTRGTQLWVTFGTLLLPIAIYLIYRIARSKQGRPQIETGITLAIGLMAVLWIAMYALGFVASKLPSLGGLFMGNLLGDTAQATYGQLVRASLFGFVNADGVSFPGRLTAPGAWVSLIVIIGLALALILALRPEKVAEGEFEAPSANGQTPRPGGIRADAFWLLLVLMGALLVLAPEFFYLRDNFGDRMNTIFKFYYTAWILWGIGAAYATASLLLELRRAWGAVWRVGTLALIAVGLTYPAWGLWQKTDEFNPPVGWTLDGTAWWIQSPGWASQPDEFAAAQWLTQQPEGVLAEASGDSYQPQTSDLATVSGYPTVLGWSGHEDQWRGYGFDLGTRMNDLATLYTTADWKTASAIIQKYDIRYIVVGPAEQAAYDKPATYNQDGTLKSPATKVVETKFQRNLPAPHTLGEVSIYTTPQTSPLEAQAAGNGGTGQ